MSKDSELKRLTEAIERLIATPVAPIVPVAPVAPVAPVLPIVQTNSGDHDILTEFRAESKVEFKNINAALIKLQESNGNYVTLTDWQAHIKDHDGLKTEMSEFR